MKKWIIIFLLVLGLVAIVFLVEKDIIRWQPLTIIVAAIAAPFKFILGLFTNQEEEIRKKHRIIRETEFTFQENLEKRIRQREKKVDLLKDEIEILDSELKILEKKRKLINSRGKGKSTEERQKEGQDLFGA